jgi:hypothetical protein
MGHPAMSRVLAEQKLRATQPKPKVLKKPKRYFTIPSQRTRRFG